MKKLVLLMICLVSLTLPVKGYCYLYSDGSDGAFHASTNMIVDLPLNGIFNFTTITVDDGVTVSFNRNADNTPVYLLGTGEVVINGIVNISAIGAIGGPGGGNAGEDLGAIVGGAGGNDDGGAGGSISTGTGDLIIDKRGSILTGGGEGGAINLYSGRDLVLNSVGQDGIDLVPFHGGSGGATGGGGGALWLSTFNNSDITIGGGILANAAKEGGSGGAISLLTDSIITIEGTGLLQANRMTGGNMGSISLEGNNIHLLEGARIGTTVVPIPGAIWLFGSGLIGLFGIRIKREN